MKIGRYLFSRNYKKNVLFLTFACLLLLSLKTLKTTLKENYLSQSVSAQTQECTADDTLNWCQIQHDPQRTGNSPATLSGTNFSIAWTRPFQPDKVFPQVQTIIYQGKVFVGTEGANGQNPSVYALNAATGTQIWKFTAGGPILASVAAGNGNIYFGAMDGVVYAVNASTGTLTWKSAFTDSLGFSTAPVLADNKIMLGSQAGIFYALNPINGNVIWQYNTNAPILQTAAYNNGRVFFGTMDMYVYGLNTANGTLSWKSAKIDAMAFKDYWPLVFQGNVYIRPMGPIKNFYALNENTGVESFQLPQFDGQTMNGATAPPCVDGRGRLVVPALVPGQGYVSGWGRLSPPNDLIPISTTSGGSGNQDENMAVSCSQNLILAIHRFQGNAQYTGAYNLTSGTWTRFVGGSTNNQMSENTQGAGTNPASIANGMIYHIVWHELLVRKAN